MSVHCRQLEFLIKAVDIRCIDLRDYTAANNTDRCLFHGLILFALSVILQQFHHDGQLLFAANVCISAAVIVALLDQLDPGLC